MMYVSLTRKKAVEVESFTAASIAVRKFIELNDYGSSDFLGGVYNSTTNKLIAKVSYNGRIWNADGQEIVSPSYVFTLTGPSAIHPTGSSISATDALP
jgi:hypothetical protein